MFWCKIAVSVALVLAGGVFAGLTIGLMGLDELHLRVLVDSSEDEKERDNAMTGAFVPQRVCLWRLSSLRFCLVLNLLQRGRHWVLVVLLLGNVIVNESLPIFLDDAIGGGLAAIIISTTTIVIFGIIPQAVSVHYGLAIGARCTPFVLVLMCILSPIAYPIARLLDRILGVHTTTTYKKAELRSLLQLHRTGAEPLAEAEISILNGVLELGQKRVHDIMTPIQDILALSVDTILDKDVVDAILSSGYSRIPVHEPDNPLAFCGLLLVKKLLMYDPGAALPVSHFKLSILPEAHPSINCFQALDYFRTGRAHLLLISQTPGVAGGGIGVITLEDVIEEIISEEIIDETDRYADNRSKRLAPDRCATSVVMQWGIVERQRSLPRRQERERRGSRLRAMSPRPTPGRTLPPSSQIRTRTTTAALPSMRSLSLTPRLASRPLVPPPATPGIPMSKSIPNATSLGISAAYGGGGGGGGSGYSKTGLGLTMSTETRERDTGRFKHLTEIYMREDERGARTPIIDVYNDYGAI
ncbi:DUF21-domain-containing protein [Coniophora puteana RWD-64-598 SS2]|uniref:DUF21-domain-containing protein n=1 Tax=Coniophora puteana (strain RWD-64-598) TaxID=741705 RepID=A0A5M3N439_CONPW|nr:DUF21-domain-containing protein [Coniophora puteana RWD-64-598 SS2]EIW86153.1 DUF21-domain-containing protein [Coniophora puteana RWD-64-598 SS2]